MAQKRSENTYQKIETIFMRDKSNIIMPYDGLTYPELEYLRNNKFRCEEKIDGTNVRLEVTRQIDYDDDNNIVGVEFFANYKGKTDKAQMPKLLEETLWAKYPEYIILQSLGLEESIPVEKFAEHKWVDSEGKPDLNRIPERLTIYGEGYGVKIQSCGGRYLQKTNDFIVFDVKVNDTYLLTEARDEIAAKLGAKTTPLVGYMTIDEAVDYVRKGFKSLVAEDQTLDAEGLVLRTDLGLRTRMGQRIIAKIKTCDFVKYRNKYGTDGKIEQEENELYNKE